MSEINIEAEVLEATLTGKNRDNLVTRILDEEISLPLKIVIN